PDGTDSVNGYFFADYRIAERWNDTVVTGHFYAFFSEPRMPLRQGFFPLSYVTSSNLHSNVEPGEVLAAGETLYKIELPPSAIYFRRNDDLVPRTVVTEAPFRWTVSGNKSFFPAGYAFEDA